MIICAKISRTKQNIGVWYKGITYDSGSYNPGSILGTPTYNFVVAEQAYAQQRDEASTALLADGNRTAELCFTSK